MEFSIHICSLQDCGFSDRQAQISKPVIQFRGVVYNTKHQSTGESKNEVYDHLSLKF
jgi:hypothetical protein